MSDTIWQLQGVVFDDGGSATGTFTTDSSGYLLSYDIVTTAGTTLSGYEFTPSDSYINYNGGSSDPSGPGFVINASDGSGYSVQFLFDNSLTGLGADPVNLTADANSEESEFSFDGEGFSDASRAVTAGDAVTPPLCYLRGTRIMTANGDIPIEQLREGDVVVCRFGGLRTIRWIGHQSFRGEATKGAEPVCIFPGALGDNMPCRTMKISQGHSMLIGENLVLGRAMVNGITVKLDAPQPEFEYFQIELDSHDCIMAEGAWSETFADAADLRRQFDNADEFYARFPGYVAPSDVSLCAPRPQSGPALEASLRPVVARAWAGVPEGPLRAFIDSAEAPGVISGWANDQHHPDLPVLLEIMMADESIGTVLACDYRHDLEKADIGRGNHSFTFRLDRNFAAADLNTLRLRRVSLHSDSKRGAQPAEAVRRQSPIFRLAA